MSATSPLTYLWDAGMTPFLATQEAHISAHTSLPVKSREFWNYTFNDMGHHDLHVSVDAALKISSRESLTYVGWSQGNTAMLIGGTDPRSPAASRARSTCGSHSPRFRFSPIRRVAHPQYRCSIWVLLLMICIRTASCGPAKTCRE